VETPKVLGGFGGGGSWTRVQNISNNMSFTRLVLI